MSDRTTVEQAARKLARAEAREADAREKRDRAICQAHAAGVRRATIASAVEMEPESVSRIVKQRRDAAGEPTTDSGALERAADQARRARAAASARAAAEAERAEAVAAALDSGQMRAADVVRVTGLSRPRVYQLRDQGRALVAQRNATNAQ
ncbi:hypothetical protein GS507_25255 [Rhodococcus hoagii]|nr:hypothetical protein [Prescottella equi]